jgi:hypothetical protein
MRSKSNRQHKLLNRVEIGPIGFPETESVDSSVLHSRRAVVRAECTQSNIGKHSTPRVWIYGYGKIVLTGLELRLYLYIFGGSGFTVYSVGVA